MGKIIRIALPLLLILVLLKQTISGLDTIALYIQNAKIIPLLLAFLVYLSIYPQAAYAWYKILTFLGLRITLIKALKIWIVSNTGRYIPGAIWQYVGRVELSRRNAKINRMPIVQSIFFEALATLAASFLVSGILLWYVPFGWIRYTILLTPLVLALLHPKISQFALTIAKKLTKKEIALPTTYAFSRIIGLLPWFILNFLLNGIALSLLLISVGQPLDISIVLFVTAAFAISWAAGYLVVLAPGGLGVADLTMATLLSVIYPASTASFIALAHRFFLSLAEFIIFGIIIAKKDKNEHQERLGRKK